MEEIGTFMPSKDKESIVDPSRNCADSQQMILILILIKARCGGKKKNLVSQVIAQLGHNCNVNV